MNSICVKMSIAASRHLAPSCGNLGAGSHMFFDLLAVRNVRISQPPSDIGGLLAACLSNHHQYGAGKPKMRRGCGRNSSGSGLQMVRTDTAHILPGETQRSMSYNNSSKHQHSSVLLLAEEGEESSCLCRQQVEHTEYLI